MEIQARVIKALTLEQIQFNHSYIHRKVVNANTIIGERTGEEISNLGDGQVLYNPDQPFGTKHEAYNLPQTQKDELLLEAAKKDNLDACKALLMIGANPNYQRHVKEHWGAEVYTPLCTAVKKGNLDMCKTLAEAGADVNLPGEYLSKQPLHVAAWYSQPAIA